MLVDTIRFLVMPMLLRRADDASELPLFRRLR